MTVGAPPPPTRRRKLFEIVHGETEELMPGHVELVDVLWEMGILPDVRVLPVQAVPAPISPTREGAIDRTVNEFSDQWATWPLEREMERRVRSVLEERFDELFANAEGGYLQTYLGPAREVLITWRPKLDWS